MNILYSFAAKLFICFLPGIVILSPFGSLHSEITPIVRAPVHEAYMQASGESDLLIRAISKAPPSPLNEKHPPKCFEQTVWIPGYWMWIDERNDFIWITGNWRRPPQGRAWIPGFWKQYDSGWVRFSGFWTDRPEKELRFNKMPPPTERNEGIPESPGMNYFWMPGYWQYNSSSDAYTFLAGQWVAFDPNWVYVPAKYICTPEGYLFIPGYWDYPLDVRGCAYTPVFVSPESRSDTFTPQIPFDDVDIIRSCFVYWPDYYLFFMHHKFFYPAFWDGWCCTPPWWNWNTCWCFSWENNWALWWWWTHPGYPQPYWIDESLAKGIAPPPPVLLEWMNHIYPPLIVSPWGIISSVEFIKAIAGIAKNVPAIFPADRKKKSEILDRVQPLNRETTILRPGGSPDASKKALPRPNFGKTDGSNQKIIIPPKPYIPANMSISPKPIRSFPQPLTPWSAPMPNESSDNSNDSATETPAPTPTVNVNAAADAYIPPTRAELVNKIPRRSSGTAAGSGGGGKSGLRQSYGQKSAGSQPSSSPASSSGSKLPGSASQGQIK